MSDDIVARLRNERFKFSAVRKENKLELPSRTVPRLALLWGEAADEIERLREEHRAACKDRDAYRSRYHRALAASVWKPGTTWKTYVNPQRSDGLFVATVGELVRPYQAVPDRCLHLPWALPHDEAEAVVSILNEWTESDAARAKEDADG